MNIRIKGSQFIDDENRILHLRGVNLGGSSKVPSMPNGATWNKGGFYDHRNVSFIGRPFPLDEADEHFTRLKKWGLTFLRLIITWEAIEHEGPGIYDEAYLNYLYQVVKKASQYDFVLFIDPHQDVWSRFSGGDGAPGWTFEAVGMDITKFHETGAAITHQECGDPYPRMIWTSNYSKFACATMWTLFFGGNAFAPQSQVAGVPVQDYLQGHYFESMKQVAACLKEFPNVIGFDTLNEPYQGYIGYPDVNQIAAKLVAQGPAPTIYQGMLLASGYPQRVEIRSQIPIRLGPLKRTTLNPRGVSLWKDGVQPIWKQNGVWDVDQKGNPHLLSPSHFGIVDGRQVDFDQTFFVPFVEKYLQAIRSVNPEAMIFVDPPTADFHFGPKIYGVSSQEGIIHAPHWYDGATLGTQTYRPWLGIDTHGEKARFTLGRGRRRKDFIKQINRLVEYSDTMFSGVPTVIGETGIPYNMNNKSAYRTVDFSKQVNALDDTLQALEANLVNFTLWNYTADNSNRRGDLWNDEDLSIFSRDQQTGSSDIHDGGRALEAVVRPYAYKIPGNLISMSFNIRTKRFDCSFRWDANINTPMELFIPDFQYPLGFEVLASDGKWDFNPDSQILEYSPLRNTGLQHISIIPKDNPLA